ncbi:DUF1643 domain-containing protein [Nocardia niigatensis]
MTRGFASATDELNPQDVLFEVGPALRGAAEVSADGVYRYELSRRWADGPVMGWVMLTPSTASADIDDPTIRRCIAFAKSWGYSGIVVRNLFALRATDPCALAAHPDPVGPDNDAYLARCGREEMAVLAWGARGHERGRAAEVLALLARDQVELYRLGTTSTGEPRHPLYLPKTSTPQAIPTQTRRKA